MVTDIEIGSQLPDITNYDGDNIVVLPLVPLLLTEFGDCPQNSPTSVYYIVYPNSLGFLDYQQGDTTEYLDNRTNSLVTYSKQDQTVTISSLKDGSFLVPWIIPQSKLNSYISSSSSGLSTGALIAIIVVCTAVGVAGILVGAYFIIDCTIKDPFCLTDLKIKKRIPLHFF